MSEGSSLLEWLLASLELDATVFHLGQYCNAWKASTSGLGRAAFHLVLHGRCWLHLPGREPIAMAAGDVVFMLRDLPHSLTPEAESNDTQRTQVRFGEMVPLDAPVQDGVGLVCGFFEFRAGLSELLARAFPDYLLVRGEDPAQQGIRSVIALIIAETQQHGAAASTLIERLTSVLFLYVVRQLAEQHDLPLGLFSTAKKHELLGIVQALVNEPARSWSLAEMARFSGMSRAAFFKRFRAAAGCSPVSFLLALRVQLAAQQLRRGDAIEEVAPRVGYQSTAAFSRAFKRVTGQQPGAYRRSVR